MARDLKYLSPGGSIALPRVGKLADDQIDQAVQSTNRVFEELHRASPHVFALLGMRNLSAFVGAVFATELAEVSDGLLLLNPHQDGYPDLLLMDERGRRALAAAAPRSKEPFSPFATGGIEIKATCGDVPTEAVLARRGRRKPAIGEARVELITSFNWKAHHRETNHLVGLLWDFVEGLPAITAITYSDALTESDWGAIVTPREGGGRTTSVSIMSRGGVEKMCSNTVRVAQGPFVGLLSRYGLRRPPTLL